MQVAISADVEDDDVFEALDTEERPARYAPQAPVLASPSGMPPSGLPSASDASPAKPSGDEALFNANRGKPEEARAERITVGGKTVELR